MVIGQTWWIYCKTCEFVGRSRYTLRAARQDDVVHRFTHKDHETELHRIPPLEDHEKDAL